MKILRKTVWFAVACVCAGAFAKPVSEMSFVEGFTLPVPTSLTTDEACENFTGDWKGVCVASGGKKTEDAVRIEQRNCDSIKLASRQGSFEMAIGGMVT